MIALIVILLLAPGLALLIYTVAYLAFSRGTVNEKKDNQETLDAP